MTPQNLIYNLRQGNTVTGFMVMGIINTLERIKSLDLRSEEYERLKDAVLE